MHRNTNGSTYPASKPIPRAAFFVGPFGNPWTALQRRLAKRRHTRKSRRFLDRQLRADPIGRPEADVVTAYYNK